MELIQNLNENEAVAKTLRLAPKLVAAILVVVICLKLVAIIFSFFGGNRAVDPAFSPAPGNTPVRGSQSAPAAMAGPIIAAHLFGRIDASEPVVKAPEQIENVPATDLNLKLKGTLAADDPKYALAIIADNANKETVYALKASVANGVTLHAVERERVILNQSGRLTALELPKEFKGPSARTPSRTPNTRAATASRSSAGSVRETLTQNASKLTDVIRPQPYFSGGKQKGYRIYPGKDRRQFAALGLRPGDLVTEINGTPMNDPQQGLAVFRSLGDATSVTVTIERNNQPQTLTLSTSQIGSQ
ncbi:MAG: type II secretion system protein GspC [Pseudomonadota bacterium]